MTDSQQLLAEYTAKHSETAFRELVSRYIDLVYSTAVRLVDGDAHRAQDVAQTVFLDLSRMAGRLSPQTMLGGWLHRHTCFVARTLMRGERRRQVRERQAMELSALNHHADPALTEISSVLDEAIQELGADDRDAILLRFFEHRNLRSVGEALGTSENVAQKRVARAVQELSTLLRRRGYGLPAAALATGLAAGAVTAAPAGLASSVAGAVFAGAGAAGGASVTAAKVAVAAKLKVGIVSALVVGAVVTGVFLRQPTRGKLSEQSVAVQQQADPPEPASPAEPAPASGEVPSPTPKDLPRSEPQVGREPLSVARPPVAVVTPPVASIAPVPTQSVVGETAPPVQQFAAASGSRLRIEGKSNLGDWQVESPFLGGTLFIGPDFPMPGQALEPGPVQAQADVFVQVHSLKSVGKDGQPYSDRMDETLYKSLRDQRNPRIQFHLEELVLKGATNLNGAVQYEFDARGELAAVGVTNEIAMPVFVQALDNRRFKIAGRTALKMTSFKIDPPALDMSLGSIKTRDEVSISFQWVVAANKGSSLPAQKGMVPLLLDLPKAAFKGTPKGLQLGPNVEPLWKRPRPAMMVPAGLKNIAPEAAIACSDRNVPAYALYKLVDGDKAAADQSIVFLRKGMQCVELDFGRPQEVFAVVIWHAHNIAKVYHDVVVQTTDGPDSSHNVRTLFNNDRDNSSGLGVGTNREYVETHEGKLIDAKGVKARFIRFYSKGSTESALNEYTEIEVYGRPAW